jgi:hypothetical protein
MKGGTMLTARRKLLVAVVVASGLVALLASAAASASGSPLTGEWNRLSVDRSHPAPEHELLRCVENSGTSSDPWFCRYSKAPEPTLNFSWNNNHGSFQGHDVTSSWICPAWFPNGVCPNVVSVVEGTMMFIDPDTHRPPLLVLQDLVVVQSPAGERLYNYWVNRFVCPWFRTFAEAIAANPLTLPFDGNFPPQDCVNAA